MSEDEPTFKRSDEQKPEDDPFADQRNYFAYWEAKRIQDRINARREWDSLSVYERARRKHEQ